MNSSASCAATRRGGLLCRLCLQLASAGCGLKTENKLSAEGRRAAAIGSEGPQLASLVPPFAGCCPKTKEPGS